MRKKWGLGCALAVVSSYSLASPIYMPLSGPRKVVKICRTLYARLQIKAQPTNLRYKLFDRSKDLLRVDYEKPDKAFKDFHLQFAKTASMERQLKRISLLDSSNKDIQLVEALLVFSPHKAVRKKAALKIRHQNQPELYWHLWRAQFLEDDPELHASLVQMASDTKAKVHKKNQEEQIRAGVTVKDEFMHPSLDDAEKQLLKKSVIEGRSEVFYTEEALFHELAALEKRALEKYRADFRALRDQLNTARIQNNKSDVEKIESELALLQSEYDILLTHIDKNRGSFREGLFKRELARVHDLNIGKVIEVLPNVKEVNRQYFSGKVPPFLEDTRGYVIESNGTFEVARGWGTPTKEFGGFFSPPRFSTILSREETRDVLATPSSNSHENWSLIKLPQNDIVVMGLTAAQRDPGGGEKPDWGVGGNGGEIQYWRPSEYTTKSGRIQQPHLPTTTVQDRFKIADLSPELRKIQSSLMIMGKSAATWRVKKKFDATLEEIERLRRQGQVPEKKIEEELELMREFFLDFEEKKFTDQVEAAKQKFLSSDSVKTGAAVFKTRMTFLILDYSHMVKGLHSDKANAEEIARQRTKLFFEPVSKFAEDQINSLRKKITN